MNNGHPEIHNSSSLTERWETVRAHASQLATELERLARDLPGEGRRQMQSLSQWFRGPVNLDEALKRPDVLAISLPLLKAAEAPSDDFPDIEHAVRTGYCSLGNDVSFSRRLIRIMLYPILVLIACFVLAVFFSFFVAIQFEEMFAEFGIQLPKLTLAVFGFAQFLRRWWWAILLLLVVGTMAFLFATRTGTNNRPANLSWLDQRLMSTRNALASWAWHISLLLQAGLSTREALDAAGAATGNQRLQATSLARAALSDTEFADCDEPYFDSPKYRLLDDALRVKSTLGKATLLQQVANYYWDRNRNIGDWWIQWLVSAMLCVVGLMILLGVLALFMPLLAIVSGLTGLTGVIG